MTDQATTPQGFQTEPMVNPPEDSMVIRVSLIILECYFEMTYNLANQVQGRLLLLPRDQLAKSTEYFGSIFNGTENKEGCLGLKDIHDLDEVLPLLFTE
jgi:hypothetical protein